MPDELLYVPFARFDAEKREVWGWACSEEQAADGMVLDLDGSVEAFTGWQRNLREMHSPFKAVGTGIEFKPDYDLRRIWVGARISKGAEDTWQKILDGTLRGFSVKGDILAKETRSIARNGQNRLVPWVTRWRMGELSVVDVPSDPVGAIQQIVRSIAAADISNPDTIVRAAPNMKFGERFDQFYRNAHEPMTTSHTHEHVGYAMDASNPEKPHNHAHTHGKDGEPDASHNHSHVGVHAVDKVVRGDIPNASDVEVSDSGTHGAANGKHAHDHTGSDGETHAEEHSHDGSGDHGHDCAAAVSRAAHPQVVATDKLITEATNTLARLYVMRRGFQRVADPTTPAGTAEDADDTATESVVAELQSLIAKEKAETDADDDVEILEDALEAVQRYAAGEAKESALERRNRKEAMATVEELTGIVRNLAESVKLNGEAQTTALTTLLERVAKIEADAGGIDKVQRAADTNVENETVVGLVERVRQLEAQPIQAGPMLRTENVGVEKMFAGGKVPTDPAQIERGFEDIAMNATDPGVRERARLEVLVNSIRAVRGATHAQFAEE